MIVIVNMLQNIWKERNTIRYQGNKAQLPIWRLLELSVTYVIALIEVYHSVKKKRRLLLDLDVLKRASTRPYFTQSGYVDCL